MVVSKTCRGIKSLDRFKLRGKNGGSHSKKGELYEHMSIVRKMGNLSGAIDRLKQRFMENYMT